MPGFKPSDSSLLQKAIYKGWVWNVQKFVVLLASVLKLGFLGASVPRFQLWRTNFLVVILKKVIKVIF